MTLIQINSLACYKDEQMIFYWKNEHRYTRLRRMNLLYDRKAHFIITRDANNVLYTTK